MRIAALLIAIEIRVPWKKFLNIMPHCCKR